MCKAQELATDLITAYDLAVKLGEAESEDAVALIEEAALAELARVEASGLREVGYKLDGLLHAVTISFSDIPEGIVALIASVRDDIKRLRS